MTTTNAPAASDLPNVAAVLANPAPQSSVEISRNSKGATWTVKAYHLDPDVAMATACRLYDELAHRFGNAEREA
jgi:hypothetical protein